MPSRSNLIATTFNFDKISTTFMNLLVTNVVITMMRLVSSRSSGRRAPLSSFKFNVEASTTCLRFFFLPTPKLV